MTFPGSSGQRAPDAQPYQDPGSRQLSVSAIAHARAGAVLAERTPSRMKAAAAWLFVLPVFAEGVLPGVVKLEVAGLAALPFVALVRGPLPPRALERVFAVTAVLSLVVIGYLAFGSWPADAGAARQYDLHAVLFVVTYATVAVFAALLFDAEIFARVMWRAATIALWVGVLSCLFSRLTGHVLLVNANDGALRMTGTLTEPSAWAPVLALVLLLALQRRSRLYVLLADGRPVAGGLANLRAGHGGVTAGVRRAVQQVAAPDSPAGSPGGHHPGCSRLRPAREPARLPGQQQPGRGGGRAPHLRYPRCGDGRPGGNQHPFREHGRRCRGGEGQRLAACRCGARSGRHLLRRDVPSVGRAAGGGECAVGVGPV